ncbi:MAG: PA2169 family four-helix-bundle protein [Chitinophagaceae bacterium]|nr:MAG: PA2169 family four-helix-bundle protein [Chitinophagaceae bacterium]
MTSACTVTIEILNELIEINYDRAELYRIGAIELKPQDQRLRQFFNQMITNSERFINALAKEVEIIGGKPTGIASIEGRIYRAWANVRTMLSKHSRYSILDSCEDMEDLTLDIYRAAMQHQELTGFLREMVSDQLDQLLHAHDKVRRLRDQAKKLTKSH